MIFIGTYYYWLKPNIIREVCEEQSLLKSVERYPIRDYPDTAERARLQKVVSDDNYSSCIGIRGVKGRLAP